MGDRQLLEVVTTDELRKKVTWLFYGTRDYTAIDSDSQEVIDDIINDGYERFLQPPPLPQEKSPHVWGFLRPVVYITTKADTDDYALPANIGGIDGKLTYQRSDSKWWPVEKTDPSRILMMRQRDPSQVTSYPTNYAIVSKTPDGHATPAQMLMLWPTPDSAYTLRGIGYVIAAKLSTTQQYPACDAYHNQCLVESCLAVAEERLEDQQAIHSTNFLYRLSASVAYDKDKYSSDHLGIDTDRSSYEAGRYGHYDTGTYVAYNGYTPGQ